MIDKIHGNRMGVAETLLKIQRICTPEEYRLLGMVQEGKARKAYAMVVLADRGIEIREEACRPFIPCHEDEWEYNPYSWVPLDQVLGSNPYPSSSQTPIEIAEANLAKRNDLVSRLLCPGGIDQKVLHELELFNYQLGYASALDETC